MTELLDEAVAPARRLPPERHDAIAATILDPAERDAEAIDPEHPAAVDEGSDQIGRGEFASDDEVPSIFRRFGA